MRAWRGLRVVDGGLWYAPDRVLPARWRLWFRPDALVVVGRRVRHELAWDAGFPPQTKPGATGWWVRDTDGEFPRVRVTRGVLGTAPAPGTFGTLGNEENWKVGVGIGWRGWFAGPPVFTVIALADYLARTPAARDALGHDEALHALLDELRRSKTPVAPPSRRFGGKAADLDYAIHAVLDRLQPRRFCGYSVRGEPTADRGTIRAAVRDSTQLASAVDEATLTADLDRAWPAFLWPFDVLHG